MRAMMTFIAIVFGMNTVMANMSSNVGKFYNETYCSELDSLGNVILEVTKTGGGTATYLRNGYGFTAAHAVLLHRQIIYVEFEKERVQAWVVQIENQGDEDFAILFFPERPKYALELPREETVIINEILTATGFPDQSLGSVTLNILAEDDLIIYTTEGVDHGFSGGLVVNSEGAVVGMVTSYAYKADGNQEVFKKLGISDKRISVITKVQYIDDLIDKLIEINEEQDPYLNDTTLST